MRKIRMLPYVLFVFMAFAMWTSDSHAYARYNDGCQGCHGSFTGSRSPKGSIFPSDDKHFMHRNSSAMGTACDLCHTDGDNWNPNIGYSNGTGNVPGLGCVGCHDGAGLRQHHTNARVSCTGCHGNETPVGENILPRYYGTTATNADQPCNPVPQAGNENWTVGDFTGLDNDGDGLYDAADPDCRPEPEICDNGIDDNGNSLVDCGDLQSCNGFTGSATSCGVGACASTGNQVCHNGGQVNTCTPGTPAAEGPFDDPSCSDQIDNDCDGVTDENDSDCDAPQETCNNGIDDNGNGLVDCADAQCDGYVIQATSCGVGACARTGNLACQVPGQADTCVPGTPMAEGPFGESSCSDGIDNDCDGLTDMDDQDCAAPSEVCDNGVDDNGNGLIDCADAQCDGFTDGACNTGSSGICAAGTNVCRNGGQVCVQNQQAGTEGPLGSETCSDGLDNDCNGLTDASDPECTPLSEICDNGTDDDGDGLVDCADPNCDGFTGGTCDTGNTGICSAGTTTCRQLQEFCDQSEQAGSEGPFTSMTCDDGLDNDCDGLTDANDLDCTPLQEVCDNGTDDNGNGLTDCQDPQCNGITFGACDTGSPGICSAGTLTCNGSAIGPVCTQDQVTATEGPFGSATCDDGLDNDCDGYTDIGDDDCYEPLVEICDNGVDDTGNGLVDCADPDCDGFIGGVCNTGNAGVCAAGTNSCQDGSQVCVQDQTIGTEGPSGSPTCQDGLDNDCDSLTDAADADCTAPSGDVSLSELDVPTEIRVKPRQVTSRSIEVEGGGTLLTQNATVTLTAVSSENVGVVVKPVSVTQPIEPGQWETEFEFTAFVSCKTGGVGTVDWAATISAPGNDDPTNDVLTGTTTVNCRGDGGRSDNDHEDDDYRDSTSKRRKDKRDD